MLKKTGNTASGLEPEKLWKVRPAWEKSGKVAGKKGSPCQFSMDCPVGIDGAAPAGRSAWKVWLCCASLFSGHFTKRKPCEVKKGQDTPPKAAVSQAALEILRES